MAGRYRIESTISTGGSGHVLRAIQEPIGRPVALKVLRGEIPTEEREAFEARFFREASLAGNLQHPNVVTVHDYGRTEDGQCFLVMELLVGHTLREVMREGPISAVRLVPIVDQLAQGLRHAHTRGLVHRDIKPGNIFISSAEDGGDHVKILDFGLVRESGGDSAITEVGTFMGTPHYMSPEQAQGKDVDARADIYSLGVVIYRAATGVLPFSAPNPAALAYLHVHEPYPPMQSRAPAVEVPPEIEAICRQCMEKNPDRRFRDGGAFLTAWRDTIRRLYGPGMLPALPDDRVFVHTGDTVVPDSPAEAPDSGGPNESPVVESRRRKAIWPYFLAVAVVLFGASLGTTTRWILGLEQPSVDPAAPVFPTPDFLSLLTGPDDITVEAPDAEQAPPAELPRDDGAPVPVGTSDRAPVVPVAPVAPVASGGAEAAPVAITPTAGQVTGAGSNMVLDLGSGGPAPTVSASAVSAPAVPASVSTGPESGGAIVFVDQVRFTADEASRALRFINGADSAGLQAAGIYGKGVDIILGGRPFTSLQAFGDTPYIGTKTVEAVRAAALR